jgi:hypothetical protein
MASWLRNGISFADTQATVTVFTYPHVSGVNFNPFADAATATLAGNGADLAMSFQKGNLCVNYHSIFGSSSLWLRV